MINMENPEEILQILERYSRQKPRDIPDELEGYLRFVARTGDTVFKWPMIQHLYREKLRTVIQNFYETTASIADLPHYPNVDPFNFEAMKKMLIERMDHFHAAPFTVQRLSELLTEPRKQYSRIDKFMRAIEKNVLVVSPAESQRKRHESENGESLDSTLSMNGDICSDLDIGVENDHGPLNLHESSKPDEELAKMDGADPLDDDVPLDKLEPEVNVFTPEGDMDTVPEIETKIDPVPNGSSTPEPASTSTTDNIEGENQIESSTIENSETDQPQDIEKSEEPISSSTELNPSEVGDDKTSEESAPSTVPEALPSKRTLENEEESSTTPAEEPSHEPSPSKKQKVDEEKQIPVPIETATTDTEATHEPTAEAKPSEPIETDSLIPIQPLESESNPETDQVTDSPLPTAEPSELPLNTSIPTVTEITTADPVIEQPFETSTDTSQLIDISLTAEPTAALLADAPTEDIINMIDAPIMEQLQSTVTNPPLDPIRLPSIDSIIPEAAGVIGLATQLDPAQSMEIAKVDDDLMKVDLPGTTTPSQEPGNVAVENKMQTDDDEAPVTSEMDVDESSADFMDQ